MTISLRAIAGAIPSEGANGWEIDWEAVRRHVEAHQGLDLHATYSQFAREWFESIAERWGGSFQVHESARLVLLTPRGEKLARNLLRLAERTHATMHEAVSPLVAISGYGKFACIVADSVDRYYGYVERFYDTEDFPATGGVFLRHGYAHFVLNHAEPGEQEFALVHELTHALLQERGLPLWLEEGITQLVEEGILGISQGVLNRELAERHRRYWRARGLGDFWRGTTFGEMDAGFELSYGLSLALVRNMLSRDRARFIRFVSEARYEDSGEGASRAVYGMSLGEWAAQFLGPGEWGVE